MADETQKNGAGDKAADRQRGIDEVSLELMKFIATTTGYGKPSSSSVGFSTGKGGKSGSEEYTDALLELYDRCRKVVGKQSS
ncbi:MAG: hypothetical protein U0R19_07635 [Bryobacteraceae bacterium]